MKTSIGGLNTKCAKATFSLVELLVTIAIIAILMAILLPLLKQAKETASRSACTNNLRQIGIAVTAYAYDFNGVFPTHDESTSVPFLSGFHSYPYGYRKLLSPEYISNWRILYCPNHPRLGQASEKATDHIGYNSLRGQQYFTYNIYDYPLLSLNDCLRYPRALYMDFTAQLAVAPSGSGWIDSRYNGHIPAPGKLKGANVLFSDGAVSWYQATRLRTHWAGWLCSMFLWPPDPTSGYDY